MNCTAIQNRLLACEQPDFPPPEVREHLADCGECRALQQRLVGVEQQITGLPVPPSDARAAFVLRFLAGDEAFRPSLRPSPAVRGKESGRLKAALAFALAAGLAVFALGWWAWPQTDPVGGPPVASSRYPDRQKQLRERLALAHTPAERVKRLTELAEALQVEARTNEADADRLAEVARFCVQVVSKDLMEHALTVPKKERKKLLTDIAERLRQIESQASRRATEMLALHVASAGASYHDIAVATGDTYHSLLKLAGEVA